MRQHLKKIITISFVIGVLGYLIQLLLSDNIPCSEFFLIAGNLTNATLILIGGEHSRGGRYINGRASELCLEHLTRNHSTHVVLIEGMAAVFNCAHRQGTRKRRTFTGDHLVFIAGNKASN